MAATEYVLQPRPPMRAFAIAALACALSIALVLISVSKQWHVIITIFFGIPGILGLALGGVSIGSVQRMKVLVRLDDTGYQVTGIGKERSGKWADVTKVTETTDGRHITIYHGSVTRTHLLCPSGTELTHFKEMLSDISRRLGVTYRRPSS